MGMDDWAAKEFGGAKLGDGRLTNRLIKIASAFAERPTASIPGACAGWVETQAAYRFFDQASEKKQGLGWEDILTPHLECTIARMRQHRVVLCLQDTTELDFNGQRIEGLGPLSFEAQRGMFLHPTYAITVDREPLGMMDCWMWAREFKEADGSRPGILESIRWIEGYERVAEAAARMPGTRLVYIADREADILGMMQRAHALETPADWMVRSKHNRCLPEGGKRWAKVRSGEALGEIEFLLPARGKEAARPVRQKLFARRVELSDGQGGLFPVTCVIAQEIGAPKGVKPIEWRLLTNREADRLEAVAELIDWYRARWEIEIFFNVLKNGCRVEALQLGHIDKIELALAVYMVVAWRLAHLVRLGRTHPDLSACEWFSEEEWKGAYLLAEKEPPSTPPNLREMIRQIAMLGGFLGRKCDGEPGVKTLWLGFARLRDFVRGVEFMRSVHDE
ncbi:MAG TPA: IS4 family transposase [Candidatus Accumulibacter phosphatis]|nr:IS4 family transposase [Candidatus Accumulibacter phosphatis]